MVVVLAMMACGGETEPPAKPVASAAPAPAPAPAPKPAPPPPPDVAAMSPEEAKAALMTHGERVYKTGGNGGIACMTCHMENGKGMPPAFPPLVGQKDHMGDCGTHAKIVINGMSGKLLVDGVEYNGVMTPQGAMLSDFEIAAVLTYERHSWGNDFGVCMPSDVKAAR